MTFRVTIENWWGAHWVLDSAEGMNELNFKDVENGIWLILHRNERWNQKKNNSAVTVKEDVYIITVIIIRQKVHINCFVI